MAHARFDVQVPQLCCRICVLSHFPAKQKLRYPHTNNVPLPCHYLIWPVSYLSHVRACTLTVQMNAFARQKRPTGLQPVTSVGIWASWVRQA